MNYTFTPKTKQCPKCHSTLSLDCKLCPICNNSEMTKEVEKHLAMMGRENRLLHIKDKHFGKILL